MYYVRVLPRALAVSLSSLLSLFALAACKKEPPKVNQPPPTLSADDRATIDKLTADAKQRATAMDEERRAIVLKSPLPFAPHRELGKCPVDFAALIPEDPSKADTNNGARALRAQRKTRIIRMTDFFRPEKPKNPTDGSYATVLAHVIEDDAPKPDAIIYAPSTPAIVVENWKKKLGDLDHGYDLSLVTTIFTEPVMETKTTFKPGIAIGMLSLWSREKHAIVCATEVGGMGSETVTMHGESENDIDKMADVDLFGDLLISTVERGLGSLVVAGPAPDAGAPSDAGAPRPAKKR
jgi:hypothetical protein